MSLILSVNGPGSIWMLADRRLTKGTKVGRDDAVKIMELGTTDGEAFLGYAGLGETAKGEEPSTWMARVFRGIKGDLKSMMQVLEGALKRQMTRHILGFPYHAVLVTALVNDLPMLYEVSVSSSGATAIKRVLRADGPPPPFGLAGSGGDYLLNRRDHTWMRPLQRLIDAYDRGKIRATAMADHMAKLNYEVHENEKTVGPRCIVVWSNREKGKVHRSGGGIEYYTGTTREEDKPGIPNISRGTDFQAVSSVLMEHFLESVKPFFEEGKDEPDPMDDDAINADLAKLPEDPDETLE